MRQQLSRALRTGVAVALLALLARRVDLRAAGTLLLSAATLPLLAAAVGAAATQALSAERLRRVAHRRGVGLAFAEAWRINLSASFYGLALPAGNVTGGFVRLQRLRRAGGGVGDALVVMTADRYLATLALALAGVLCLPLARVRPPSAASATLAAAAGGLLLLLPLRRPLARLSASWAGRLLPTLDGDGPRLVAPSPLALSLLAQAAGIASFVCLARAVGIGAPILSLAWIRCLTLLLTLLPISIAGLGVREAALVALLAPFGVSAERGVALALLVFLLTTLLPAVAGGVLATIGDADPPVRELGAPL